jgi:amidophosphoribosyltransferase
MMQIIDGVQVSSARGRMGEKLAQRVLQEFGTTQLDIDVVMPVPETSRTAALACARILKRPYREVPSPSRSYALDTLF